MLFPWRAGEKIESLNILNDCKFLSSKAVDEDASENDSESEESSSSSDDDEETYPTTATKKGRILKAFVDSDDENQLEISSKNSVQVESEVFDVVSQSQNVAIESEAFDSTEDILPNVGTQDYDPFVSQEVRESEDFRASQPCRFLSLNILIVEF